MEKFKLWIKKNWMNTILISFFIVLLVSPDAKAWWMRQIISTGLLNSRIEDQPINSSGSEQQATPISFRVKGSDGKILETSDLKGKVVFINFWASWCPPCRAEFPSIQKFYEKYKTDSDMVFIMVNLDDIPGKGKDYLIKENFTFPFYIPEAGIPQKYFGGSLPTTVVLDKNGKIRLHHSGMADYSSRSFYEQINQLLKE